MMLHWSGEQIINQARMAWDKPNKFFVEITNMGAEVQKILGY